MQQTLFEITGTTETDMLLNIIDFFTKRCWTSTEVTDTQYDLKYKNMILRLSLSSSKYNFYYYSNVYPDLYYNRSISIPSFKKNNLYIMRIRYIENKNFCYVELWSRGYDSNFRDSIFSFNTKDTFKNNTINYFGRRNVYDDSSTNNVSEDLTFKIASELDENYPDKYAFATYLKPIATTDSQMLMTENGIPLVDANLGINKGEVLGTKILMGAIKNKTYKIGEEYWFCFYPNYVALIEEKELITESEETN